MGPAARGASGELQQLMNHSDPMTQVRAALALERVTGQTSASLQTLTKGLSSQDPAIRNAAIGSLSQIASDLAETNPASSEQAAPVVSALTQHLNDPDPVVRWRSILSLGHMGSEAQSSIPALSHLLQDEDPFMRWAAASALGEIELTDRQAFRSLIQAASDPDPFVRQQVNEVLNRIRSSAEAGLTQTQMQTTSRLSNSGNIRAPMSQTMQNATPLHTPPVAQQSPR